MYRKVTLLVMVALAVTLASATWATAAPKEKRTVCQDGVTKEVPAHSKGHKNATEGPCEEEPPPGPDPVQACTDMGGVMKTDTRCAVTSEEWIASGTGIRDSGYLVGDLTKYYEWDGTQFVGSPEEDFVIEGCLGRSLSGDLVAFPTFYPACYHPVYNPDTNP
jgi:hypothetical protein